MQKALHLKTTVLPGGRIEIVDHDLSEGETVDVVVTPSASPAASPPRRSAVDILAEGPGQRLFKTAADVDSHIQAERESWER